MFLYYDILNAPSVANQETALSTIKVPPNTFGPEPWVDFRWAGLTANNANLKTLKLQWEDTVLLNYQGYYYGTWTINATVYTFNTSPPSATLKIVGNFDSQGQRPPGPIIFQWEGLGYFYNNETTMTLFASGQQDDDVVCAVQFAQGGIILP